MYRSVSGLEKSHSTESVPECIDAVDDVTMSDLEGGITGVDGASPIRSLENGYELKTVQQALKHAVDAVGGRSRDCI